MKKKILIGLALMLSMMLLAVPVFAANGAAAVSSTSGNPGEIAYLTVSVSGVEQADSMSIVVSGLTLDAGKSSWLQESMLSDFSGNAGVWAAGSAMDVNGDVAKLAFTIPDPAANGGKWESEVSVTVRVKNDTEDLGSFTAVGKITVICSHEDLTETPAKPATCTAPGNNQYFTCQDCGKILAADKTTVTTDEEQLIPQLEHKWDDGVVTKEPTEDAEGAKLFTCERCEETREEILPALDHIHEYASVVTAPTYTEKGYTTHTCKCGDSYVDSYMDPLPVPDANIQVARMILGNELAMQFAFNQRDIVDGASYKAVITKTYADGRANVVEEVPQSEWKINGPYYYVSFNGIAAKEMGDAINVQILTADGVAVGDVYTDSVKDYAIRQLRKTTDAKTRTLYVDMLNYGAAAQTYFGYAADDLVTAELTETEKGYGTKEVMLENNLMKGTGYVASQLDLGSSILLRVKFNGINSSMRAEVSFTSHTGAEKKVEISGDQFISGGTVVVINQVVAADYNQNVTIKVYDGNEEVANATESVASYLSRQLAKDNPLAIYDAVAKYCAAAYGYLHK